MSGFKMTPTPEQMSDTGISRLAESEANALAHERIAADLERAVKLLGNAETVFKPEIDLRGKNLDVRYELVQGGWSAWDANRYDGAPDAARADRFIGYGREKEDALTDLLEQIAQYAAEHPRTRVGRTVHSSPFEPPTVIDDPVDFDDELEPADER